MIIVPNTNGCTFITDDGFTVVDGHPAEIVHGLFVKEVVINPKMSVIMPTIKEVSVFDNGDILADMYCELLESQNIKVKRIQYIKPNKIFTEVKWVV